MAVPNSGTLSQLALAQECLYGTYGSGTITGPISMYNLVNGGNTGGGATSGNTYPAVNTGCLPNPANRGSNQLTAVTDQMGASNVTYYYNSNIGAASNLAVGDYLYTDSSLSTPASIIYGVQTGSSASTTICSAGQSLAGLRTVYNSDGRITDIGTCS